MAPDSACLRLYIKSLTLLNNEATLTSVELQNQLRQLLQTMHQGKAALGTLEAGIDHTLESHRQLLGWTVSHL